MNSRHSYLDSLNAGRQRRATENSMEQLTRSLETLEQRIGRAPERQADHRETGRRDPLPQIETSRMETARRRAEAAFDPRGDRPAPRTGDIETSYRTLPREFERLRTQEDSVAAVGKIASELKGLREELRQQMTTGLKREFDALRDDIERAYYARPEVAAGPDLTSEFERLSNAIQSLSQNTDDKGLKLLRLELEQVRGALDSLAREETVRSVDQHWDELDRRFSKFEDRFASGQRVPGDDPAIQALGQRLEQISRAVNDLPESLSLRSLEEKVRTLAGAIDHFASQQDSHPTAPFDLIEERLDEISRAIVASAAAASAPQFDPEPFERIEARITSLARQIEELVEDRPTVEVVDRLNLLSQRVDEIATRAKLPDQTIERLANQIGIIAERLDRQQPGIDTEDLLRGIEGRFDALSRLLDRRQDNAIEQGQAMFRDLEQRLELLATRLDQAPPAPAADHIFQGIEQRFDMLSEQLDRKHGDATENEHSVLRELEQRLQHLAERLDERNAEPALDGNEIMNIMDSRFEQLARRLEAQGPSTASDSVINQLEARLEDISARLEQSSAQVAAVDPDIIRSLEAQVAELSHQLARPAATMREFDDLGPRLDDIERTLTDTREVIIQAARQAAESAVRGLAASETDQALVEGLNADLKSLEDLSRRSDERNTKTFEAIHDTLLKIVERLASLEDYRAPADKLPSTPTRSVSLRDAPSIEPVGALPLDAEVKAKPATAEADARQSPSADAKPMAADTAVAVATLAKPSPAEAALAAAADAVGAGKPAEEQAGRVRSMLGGLTRAFARKQPEPAKTEPTLPGMSAEAAPSELDQPLDPKVVNRPLEPGSGAPDLNAIMRRVRDERSNQPRNGSAPAGSSEFVMAARRRAQEAAAEAQILKRGPDKNGDGGSKIGGLLHNKRKLLLMSATGILVVLAGFQLSKAFFGGDPQITSEGSAPTSLTEDSRSQPATADATSALPTDQGSAHTPDVQNDSAEMSPIVPAPGEGSNSVEATAPESEPATAAAPTMAPSEAPAVAAAPPTDATDAPATPDTGQTASATPDTGQTASAPQTAEDATDAEQAAPKAEDPALASVKSEAVPVEAGPVPLREAAEAGDPKAMFTIGSRYAEGRGTKSDMKAAARWYEKAAELGFALAQYRIGNFYDKGIGVDRNVAKAKTWYQMAAEQGNASAMHNLAVLFATGVEGPADNDSAARWFQKAAELGVKDSQFNLGILSARGLGVPQNLEESYKWFALVAKTGDRDAAAKRDDIANALRPEQLKSARAAVELWKPKPVDADANTVSVPDAWTESEGKTASVDMKKAIRNIQIILNKNGYDAGSSDGVMGEKTKQAIMAFQKANGMDATGEIDQTLVNKLLEKK